MNHENEIMIIAIDPGAQGAIAFMSDDGQLLAVEDMPVDQVVVGGKKRSRISRVRMVALLKGAEGHAFIERPEGRPLPTRDKNTGATVMRQPGAAGMLSFGESFGTAATACVAAGLALTEVAPKEWKRQIGASADKDACRRLAAEWFPAFAHMFEHKKDDGRGEAAIMARYGHRVITGRTLNHATIA